MSDFVEVPRLVVFTNLNGYTAQTAHLEDLEVAGVMDGYYQLASRAIGAAGGQVVKFIGDANLAVFPSEGADRAVLGVLDLKASADAFMLDHRWDCTFVAKVHFGSVAAGQFGPTTDRRFDVLGKVVNIAARLDSGGGVTLSAEAFRQLGPEVRRRFKKHTPPVTYIRQEDSHRPRWTKRA